MRALLCVVALAGCGDDGEPVRHDAPTIADAAIDAPPDAYQGACRYPSDCANTGMPTCCIAVSPGGASYTFCSTAANCSTFPHTCELGQPCEDASKTCKLTQVTITAQYYVCS